MHGNAFMKRFFCIFAGKERFPFRSLLIARPHSLQEQIGQRSVMLINHHIQFFRCIRQGQAHPSFIQGRDVPFLCTVQARFRIKLRLMDCFEMIGNCFIGLLASKAGIIFR